MKRFLPVMAVLLALGLAASGCGSTSTTPTPTGGLTPAQQTAIRTDFQTASNVADSALKGGDPVNALVTAKAQMLQLATVENAWTSGRSLFVKFKNGGKVSWNAAKAEQVPPYGNHSPRARARRSVLPGGVRELVGNKKALLINMQYNDDSRPYCKRIINDLSAEFRANEYTVNVVNGSAVSVSFMGSGLGGYGAIFFISHGCYDGTNTWLTTGQTATMDDLFTTYLDDWINDRVSLCTVDETHGTSRVGVRVLMVSQAFIANRYAAATFPHSLVYLVACESFTGTSQLAQAFATKGAGAVVGWDQSNCLGQSTGWLLFDAMLGGVNLSQAYTGLPDEARNDGCNTPTAHLVYYPGGGGTVQLVDTSTVSLVISSPVDGGTVTSRIATLTGKLRNAKIRYGTVELNGVTTSMTVINDSTFSQPLVLQPGANSIRANCYGMKADSTSVFASGVVIVHGQFAQQALWTEMRWNTTATDVDFHLLPPGSTFDDLWTTNDCYYSNKSPAFGAVLDVDNTHGYGPEHITIDSLRVAGTYHLYVHYYSGTAATQAYVSVAANGSATRSFGPYDLSQSGGRNRGDVWEVCTITYPGGTVTPVNQLHALGKPRVGEPNDKLAKR